MALLSTELSLWETAFRWAGRDPDRFWLLLPLAVRDNFRTLMDAILQGHLGCESLLLEKYHGDDREEASLHIRYWLDDVYACIWGKKFNRKLLRHASIDRQAFLEWCERRGVPLPEFWFPEGWNIEYKWPDEEVGAENRLSVPDSSSSLQTEKSDSSGLKPSQKARIASQQIASVIWRDEPTRTIASVCKDELLLKYGGGDHYEEDTVRNWVKAAAPPEVSQKRGRPPNKNPAEDE